LTRTGRHGARGALLAALALLFAVTPVAALADDITVTANVDRTTVSADRAVTLTVQVSGAMQNVPEPKLPSLDDSWSVRTSGTSSNMSWVNGRVSVSKSFNYTLLPRRTGTLTIGSIEVDFEGTVYSTDPIDVDVVEGAAPPTEMEERPSSGVDSGGRDIFITTSVDKTKAYVGEQITLSFKFYRRVTLFDQPRYEAPDLQGFWVEDLGEVPEYYETVKGLRYRVIELRSALFGTSAGTATIGPARLTYRKERQGFTFFSTGGTPVTLQTEPIDVEVVPLPADGRPADFDGAVGDFDMTARLTERSVSELQPVTLELRISGTGNIRTVPEPELPELPDFKVYESSSSTETTKSGAVGGVKRYEYVLVPQSSGAKTIPAMSLAYFDPDAGEYRTSAAGPLQLDVTPRAEGEAQPDFPVPAAVSRLGRDIRYIREPGGELVEDRPPLHGRPWFLMLQLVPVVMLVGAAAYGRRRDRLAGDEGLARHLRATSLARRELKEARAMAARGNSSGVCAAASRAVTDFIGNRLNVQARGMTSRELESVLRENGADDQLVARVRELLTTCDLGRFAAGADRVEAERILGQAEDCMKALGRLTARGFRR